MLLELSDLVVYNDGNEEEVKQLVSQWMCDTCRDFHASILQSSGDAVLLLQCVPV